MLLFDPSSYPFEGVVYLAGVLYILQHLVKNVLDLSTRGEELSAPPFGSRTLDSPESPSVDCCDLK